MMDTEKYILYVTKIQAAPFCAAFNNNALKRAT